MSEVESSAIVVLSADVRLRNSIFCCKQDQGFLYSKMSSKVKVPMEHGFSPYTDNGGFG
jgi:hypothetical protein